MATKSKHRSVSTGTTTGTSARTSSRTFTQEFNPDYSYVKHDLKRIAYLAGTFIVILVVLSFFLR